MLDVSIEQRVRTTDYYGPLRLLLLLSTLDILAEIDRQIIMVEKQRASQKNGGQKVSEIEESGEPDALPRPAASPTSSDYSPHLSS